MPFEPIPPRRLFRRIAEQVAAMIEQGELPHGSRLPAERDLAERLQVSRPSLREALIALEIEGLVEVRGGSGVYVRGRRAGAGPSPQEAPGPFDIIGARLAVEPECAALAARRVFGISRAPSAPYMSPRISGSSSSPRSMPSSPAASCAAIAR